MATVSVTVVKADYLGEVWEDQGNLPAECYNPSGDSCDWYRQCFEKRFPCQHTSYPYAIGFAEHYCEKYGKMYSKFLQMVKRGLMLCASAYRSNWCLY